MNIDSFQAQSSNPLIINLNTNNDDLTSLHSSETLTLLSDEAPIIKALADAVTEAEYQLYVDKIPRNHKVKIESILYVQYEPYRPRNSKRTV